MTCKLCGKEMQSEVKDWDNFDTGGDCLECVETIERDALEE